MKYIITLEANGEEKIMTGYAGVTCDADLKEQAGILFGAGVKFVAKSLSIGLYRELISID